MIRGKEGKIIVLKYSETTIKQKACLEVKYNFKYCGSGSEENVYSLGGVFDVADGLSSNAH